MRAKIRDFTLNYFLGAVILLQTAFATQNGTTTSTIQITDQKFKIKNNSLDMMLSDSSRTPNNISLLPNLTTVIDVATTTTSTSTAFNTSTTSSSLSSSSSSATVTSEIKTTNVASTSSSSGISTGDVIFSRKIWTKNDDSSKKSKYTQSQMYRNNHHHEHHWGPFFEEPLLNASQGALQLVAHLSTEAALNCRVGMLRDKTVMWVRRTTEKVSLLTVGNVTYSGDPRIRVKFQYPNNWRLLINPVHRDDGGLYMCQVSTHPPRLFVTNLTVLDPPIRVIDEKGRNVHDRYYKAGSTIDLTCQVNKHFIELQKGNLKRNLVRTGGQKLNDNELTGLDILKYITWKKDNDVIKSEAVSNRSHSDEWFNIRLIIPHANFLDNGLYKCSIANLYETVVQVQILTGELPAAVQHNNSIKYFMTFHFLSLTIFLTTITTTLIHKYYLSQSTLILL